MRQDRNHPQRYLRDHADDDEPRQALAEGRPAAMAAAVARIRADEAAALEQLRAPLQP